MNWAWRGLRQGVKTLPDQPSGPGVSPFGPVTTPADEAGANLALCPTGALRTMGTDTTVDAGRCVQCQRCRLSPSPMRWQPEYAGPVLAARPLPRPFRHSIHVRILDAGDCTACLNEVRQLTSPVYSLHRFGIFVTPTPRDADVLLVVGPVTVAMEDAFKSTYEAMTEPKRVIAAGACALTGGVFAGSFATRDGVTARTGIPVHVAVPGCPPPPALLLRALRLVMGQEGAAEPTAGGVR